MVRCISGPNTEERKKDDLGKCDNWRGIALLNVVGKVVTRILHVTRKDLKDIEMDQSKWYEEAASSRAG